MIEYVHGDFPRKHTMISRLITAAIGIPALALIVWLGGPLFSVALAVIAALGAAEVCDLARSRGFAPSRVAAAILSAVLVLSHYGFSATDVMAENISLLVASVTIAFLALVLTFSPLRRFQNRNAGLTLAAVVYPGGLLAHAALLRSVDQGLEWAVLLLAVTFSTDTAAFFVGRSVGRRPLAPAVSPRKTWEGAIGGFLSAIIAAIVTAWALGISMNPPTIAILGALMGIVGQTGDLFESKLKRLANVKESGLLLPGHGGVLDRLDSIVFNVALVYYFVIVGGTL